MKSIRIFILSAVLLNGIMEILNRRSLWDGAVHLCTAPHIFIYNTLIILVTLSLCLFFRHRKFAFGTICLFWIITAVVNFILRSFRKTPFLANDFTLISDAFKIGPVYLGRIGCILILALVGFVIIAVPYVGYHSPKVKMEKQDYCFAGFVVGGVCLFVMALTLMGYYFGVLPKHYSNIGRACEQYGYAYCFSTSFLKQGIGKPEDYTAEMVEDLLEESEEESPEYLQENDYPNVIFLQLESFMNPNLIRGVEYTKNPTEYFEWLVVNYPSGYLSVPAFGAGTANTEFEVMTSMNLEDFGLGEYPHKSILKSNTCESTAYILKELGFTAHAIHNNDATFYGRNIVFKNLGFDTFTTIEYMDGYELTPIGWAKDKVLVEQINKALDSTEGKDYIYAISVQGHGDYPDDLEGMDINIYEKGFFEEEEEQQFVYYVNQLEEMDEFIRELTVTLSKREEKTVLVMFGDHLPGFSFSDENLENEDIYETQYVVWSNYGLWLPKKNLEAFQLSSWVLDGIGVSNGILNRYHQSCRNRADYLERLTLLEYDMLYGEGAAYENQERYKPSDMVMGLDKIEITRCYNYDGHICVEGLNFNSYSDVVINDKIYDAICVNEHTLFVEDEQLSDGDFIGVVQRGEDKIVLSETEVFVYTGEEKE